MRRRAARAGARAPCAPSETPAAAIRPAIDTLFDTDSSKATM